MMIISQTGSTTNNWCVVSAAHTYKIDERTNKLKHHMHTCVACQGWVTKG
jgi:hypothetical protein